MFFKKTYLDIRETQELVRQLGGKVAQEHSDVSGVISVVKRPRFVGYGSSFRREFVMAQMLSEQDTFRASYMGQVEVGPRLVGGLAARSVLLRDIQPLHRGRVVLASARSYGGEVFDVAEGWLKELYRIEGMKFTRASLVAYGNDKPDFYLDCDVPPFTDGHPGVVFPWERSSSHYKSCRRSDL